MKFPYKLRRVQSGGKNRNWNTHIPSQLISLAFWKKAAEHRIEAMKANNPIPIIREIPATTKSNTNCTLNPISTIAISFPPSFIVQLNRKIPNMSSQASAFTSATNIYIVTHIAAQAAAWHTILNGPTPNSGLG